MNRGSPFIALLLGVALLLFARPAEADASAWNVPGDLAELIRACGDTPGLQTFCRSGYLGIESGAQAVLLGSKIPVADAAHIPWAKPYARGPIRILFISTVGHAPAELEQLAQVTRELECDARWVLVAQSAVSGAPDELYITQYLPNQARAALREHFDVIVMSFGTWTPGHGYARKRSYFPNDVYQTILQKVQQGTGLVLVGQFDGDYWVDGTPLAKLLPAKMTGRQHSFRDVRGTLEAPAGSATFAGLSFDSSWLPRDSPLYLYDWQLLPGTKVLATIANRPAIMARDYGRGRAVLLGWDGTLVPYSIGHNRLGFEYSMAIALRAIAYAARKEPPVALEMAQPPMHAGQALSVQIRANQRARASYVLRDERFHEIAAGTAHFVSGANMLELPPLPAGRHWLEVTTRDKSGKSLGWETHELAVEAEPWLAVSVDKESYKVGETAQIVAHLGGNVRPLGGTMELEIRDAADRLVAQERAPVTDARVAFAYPIHDARVAPHTATVTLYVGDAPLLRSSTEFFVPDSSWRDYENVLWPLRAGHALNATMRDEGGFTAVFDAHGGQQSGWVAARYGLRAARMNDAVINPASIQVEPHKGATQYDETLARSIRAAERYGALAWVFQDERAQLSDAGMPNAEGLRRFRAYLEEQYRSLNALNASWGTSYKSWSEAKPTLGNGLVPGTKNLAPWIDFRKYVADEAFRADQQHARMVRSVLGPDAAIGIDGFTTSGHAIPYAGLDFGRLTSEGVFNFYCPYQDDFVFTSLVRGPTAKYVGWAMSRSDYLGLPWRDAFRGHRGTFRFIGPTFYSDFGWLQPAGKWTGEGTRELRHGIGKLLMSSVRQRSPVTILYSYASMLSASSAHLLASSRPLDQLAGQSRAALEQLLIDSAVSFGYQTEAQIAAGGLEHTKLLVLPMQMAMALSPRATDAIRLFVRAGGTVLADMAPALLDEHGRPQRPGTLDELFGIARERFEPARASSDYGVRVDTADELVPGNQWFVDASHEVRVRTTSGSPRGRHLDTAPALITKRTGAGRSILLNFLLTTHVPGLTTEVSERALMARVLATAGVKPLVRIESSDAHKRQAHCEVNQFQDGSNEYWGLYAYATPSASPETVEAHFEEERETYDVRSGAYLGRVRKVPLPLREGEAALFARLEYKLTDLHVEGHPARRGQPAVVDLRITATGRLGKHVVRVEITDPAGAPDYFYTRNVVVTEGRGSFQFTPALNDPVGTWRVSAREVVSGLTAEASIGIE